MTRPSERELQRAIAQLKNQSMSGGDATTLIVPDNAVPDEHLPPNPDVSVDAVTVSDADTGSQRYSVPLHLDTNRTGGIPLLAERSIRNAWGELDAEQRQRELSIRAEHDLPVPSILANSNA